MVRGRKRERERERERELGDKEITVNFREWMEGVHCGGGSGGAAAGPGYTVWLK